MPGHRRPLRPQRDAHGPVLPRAPTTTPAEARPSCRSPGPSRRSAGSRSARSSSPSSAGEEMGLQGSTWFAAHVPGPVRARWTPCSTSTWSARATASGPATSAEPAGLRKVLEDADARLGVLRSTGSMRGSGRAGLGLRAVLRRGHPLHQLPFERSSPGLSPDRAIPSTVSIPTSSPTPRAWRSSPRISGRTGKGTT